MTNAAASKPSAARPRRFAPWITAFILIALASFLLWRGIDFYRRDGIARLDHPDYEKLRAAGLVGHGYGIVGTGLILTNLLYLIRRRFQKYFPSWLGSVKTWLDLHVVTGLAGSLLVLFHSAFQLRTPIATVTSVSLAIVVVTGLVGLYIHALVPKPGATPLKERLEEVAPLLPSLAAVLNEYVKTTPTTRLPADASLLRVLFSVPRWILEARARRRGIRKAAYSDKLVRVVARKDPDFVRDLVTELGQLAASEVDLNAGSALMRSWRSLHRFLALLMVLSVTVHIGVAWFYGFRWIWSK